MLLVSTACTSSFVKIGEHDGGSDRSADSSLTDGSAENDGGSVPCGDNRCGDHEYCCNASCGICAPEGTGCSTIVCEPGSVFCNGERCESETAVCCPGCNPGESYCSGPEGICPLDCPPPVPGCEAQDAHGTGACDGELGFAWDGSACVALNGCACEGADCDGLGMSLDACRDAFWPCMQPPSCVGDSDCDVGDYCETCASSSCFGCDDCVAGCIPHGCMDTMPLTCARPRPDCGDDGVAVVEVDGCWKCVDRATCAPLPSV